MNYSINIDEIINSNGYIDIEYDNFEPIIGHIIEIPAYTILYRSYNINYKSIKERPLFFGSLNTASAYLKTPNETRILGKYSSKTFLKLIDIRYMKIILIELFKTIKKEELTNLNLIDIIDSLNISFGLCNYENQLELINERFIKKEDTLKHIYLNMKSILDKYKLLPISKRDPIKGIYYLDGVRFGEKHTDTKSCEILQSLFNNICDGFIAPRLWSPFHYETGYYTHSEICIFNPKQSGIFEIDESINKIQTINYTFDQVINISKLKHISFLRNNKNFSIHMNAGESISLPNKHLYNPFERNDIIMKDTDKDYNKKYNKLNKLINKSFPKLKLNVPVYQNSLKKNPWKDSDSILHLIGGCQ